MFGTLGGMLVFIFMGAFAAAPGGGLAVVPAAGLAVAPAGVFAGALVLGELLVKRAIILLHQLWLGAALVVLAAASLVRFVLASVAGVLTAGVPDLGVGVADATAGVALPMVFFGKLMTNSIGPVNRVWVGSGVRFMERTRIRVLRVPRVYKKSTNSFSPVLTEIFKPASSKKALVRVLLRCTGS